MLIISLHLLKIDSYIISISDSTIFMNDIHISIGDKNKLYSTRGIRYGNGKI